MMPMQTPQQGVQVQALLEDWVTVRPELRVTSLEIDSRKIQPGALFLAVAGQASHGLHFVDQALLAGAAVVVFDPAGEGQMLAERHAQSASFIALEHLSERASIIADRFYAKPSATLSVVGITGTNGKTSCSHFLGQVMDLPKPAGVIGTLGWGLSGQLVDTINTTPDPVSVQAHLADMLNLGAQSVAMEVSSHGMDQERVSGVRFKGAVFTNLGRDHLDYHGDEAAYLAAKQKLFARPELEFAVVNLDDPAAVSMLNVLPKSAWPIGYTWLSENASSVTQAEALRAYEVQTDLAGLRFMVEWQGQACQVESRLLGQFNVDNLLAVMGVLLAQGLSLDTVAARVNDLRSIPGRMECFGVPGQSPLVIVDYAHTADALERVLMSLRPHCPGRLITVFGCGGDRDVGKRPQMAEVVERLSDRVIVTDDNPRSESPEQITDQILEGMRDPATVDVIHDRRQAIERAVLQAGRQDLVLVAGKGHETNQLIGDRSIPFSDRVCARESILKWSHTASSESGWKP